MTGWFYHVAYQYPIRGGLAYGDTTITFRWRLDSDEKVCEVRAWLREDTADVSPPRIGELVITSITLLAPGADDTGRLPGCPCGLTGPVSLPEIAIIDPDCPHHGAIQP